MKRLLHTNSIDKAKEFLQQFPEDTIEFVNKYKDRVKDLHVVELEDGEWVEKSTEAEIARLNYRYSTVAYGEGYVDDIDDFDRIYEALCLIDGTLTDISPRI